MNALYQAPRRGWRCCRRGWRLHRRAWLLALGLLGAGAAPALAQTPLSWPDLLERFRSRNPELMAGRAQVEGASAEEITARLRPNPAISLGVDQVNLPAAGARWGWNGAQWAGGIEQVVERGGKRALRMESARFGTSIATAEYADLERQAVHLLRESFIGVLLARSLADLAMEDLAAYDRVIALNRERHQAGDISRVDLARIELQRAQFEADSVDAALALRGAKQEILALLDDPTPVEAFEIEGDFELRALPLSREAAERLAFEARPDLRSAGAALRQADAEQRLARAHAIPDPQFALGLQRALGENALGLTVGIPLQLFDRNQGERARTGSAVRGAEATRRGIAARITREVEAAYDAVVAAESLAASYRDRYLQQAQEVRETISFSYRHGEASLLEFLDAEQAWRETQITHRHLIARFLSSLNQLETAIGREIL